MIAAYVKTIKKLREEKSVSQLVMAQRLGMSRASYIAIEQGRRELTVSELEKVSHILGVSLNELESGESPDYEKYKQMILSFLRLDKRFTKTKLAKMLYFADFSWYYTHLHSMSGMQYRKIHYGPVADAYFRLIDEMADAGEIQITQTDDGAMLISQTRSGARVALDHISDDEASLIKKIESKWKGKKTAEIVKFTHNQLPFLFAQENEIVSYPLFTRKIPMRSIEYDAIWCLSRAICSAAFCEVVLQEVQERVEYNV